MNCISCGVELPDGALFCLKCGERQTEPVPAKPQPVEAAALRLQRGLAFLDNWLAFVAVGVLATTTAILFAVGSLGFTAWNAASFLQQFFLAGSLAVTALASSRTGGLDLSAGAMMALSAMIFAMNASENHAGAGLLLALIVCGALGLLNRLFIMVLRFPAILVTAASVVLVRGIAMWASGGISVELPAEWAAMNGAAALLALLAAVGAAIILLWRTGGFAKEQKSVRGEMGFFWIYGLTAMTGALAGWAAAIGFGTASGDIGSGSSNEMILLFVFATISASALLKNNWAALGWVLLMALLWTTHDQAMILLGLDPFSMRVSNASWVFILLAVMAISRRSWEKPARKLPG